MALVHVQPGRSRCRPCRKAALRFDQIFADTPCVKADMHSPVDRVLLRDASRTPVFLRVSRATAR